MKVETQERRQLTPEEKLIEKEYELRKLKRLIYLIGQEIGKDKIVEIARSKDYPKTKEQVIEMVRQGELIENLPRHSMFSGISGIIKNGKSSNGMEDFVKWSDIENVI